jgi:chromosomal replication initiation ATPase DnaA
MEIVENYRLSVKQVGNIAYISDGLVSIQVHNWEKERLRKLLGERQRLSKNQSEIIVYYTHEVCAHTNIDPALVLDKKRGERAVTDSRHAVCWLAYKHRKGDGLTLKAIGRALGGRDHSTILHSIDAYEDLLFHSKNQYGFVHKIKPFHEAFAGEYELHNDRD